MAFTEFFKAHKVNPYTDTFTSIQKLKRLNTHPRGVIV